MGLRYHPAMAQTEYLRFLVATQSDPDLRADLNRASRALRTLDDLVDFAGRHGFRFDATDIPLRQSPGQPESR